MDGPHDATVSVRADGRVTVATIERPERRNAVDVATAAELVAAFTAFEADAALAVAILQGRGGAFCAGADLKAIAAGERKRVAENGDGPMGPTRMKLSKPVIAAVEGPAVAGGLELAIWADSGSRAPTPCSASTAGASACRSSTSAPYACRGSSVTGARWTLSSRAAASAPTRRCDRPRGPRRAGGRGPSRGARARARDREPPADLHAQRPPLGDRAVGPDAGRSRAQRGPPGPIDDGLRRDAPRRGAVQGRRRAGTAGSNPASERPRTLAP